MSDPPRLLPEAPGGPPVRPWLATAATAALAAVMMVALPNAAITAAGLAAGLAAVTALAEAGLRPRRGIPSRLSVSLTAMLALAAALLCLLGLAGRRLD